MPTSDRPARPIGSTVAASVLRIIVEQPGIHFRELARAAGLHSTGQLRHHLDRLQRSGRITEVPDGGYRRYFPTGTTVPVAAAARFQRPLPRRIGLLLLERPRRRTELRRELACPDSTLGYQLERMLRDGDLQRTVIGGRPYYALSDPDVFARCVTGVPRPSVLRVVENGGRVEA